MKFKVLIVTLFFISILLPGINLAQSKVVVIPLDSGNCDCAEIPTVTSAGQVWMDRNLGAHRVAQSDDDYQAYGWWYQWGRLADRHEVLGSWTTATPSSSNVPGHGNFITASVSPFDWRIPQNPILWQGVSGTNNPCPAGFRIPTETEWETEMISWSSNNSAGAFASPLKLVLAGWRGQHDGTSILAGIEGTYWSSTVNGTDSQLLSITSGSVIMTNGFRAAGMSVRCIKD